MHLPCDAPRAFSCRPMKRSSWLQAHGLSLTLAVLFLVTMAGQTLTGYRVFNDDAREHGESPVSLVTYLTSGHFYEATAENWESEFLQMAFYVLLTVFLYQRGSSESKKIGETEAVDRDPRLARDKPNAPWPVRRGGWLLKLYENSLSLAFLLLFLASFALHAVGGAAAYNQEATAHAETPLTTLEFLASAQFWFESFQNWQSEFLSLVTMVILSVYLRQRGSPESKPVDAAHDETGSD
jgi:hypothetical protein